MGDLSCFASGIDYIFNLGIGRSLADTILTIIIVFQSNDLTLTIHNFDIRILNITNIINCSLNTASGFS